MKSLLLVSALLAVAVTGCNAPPTVAPDPAAAPVVAAPKSDLVVEFRSVSLPDHVGDDYLRERASHGGRLIVVQYTIKNTSSTPIPAYELPAVRLFDRNGVSYAPDAGLTGALATEPGIVANNKVVSDLNPGIMTQGADVFEISEAAWAAGGWRLGWEGAAESELQPIAGHGTPNGRP